MPSPEIRPPVDIVEPVTTAVIASPNRFRRRLCAAALGAFVLAPLPVSAQQTTSSTTTTSTSTTTASTTTSTTTTSTTSTTVGGSQTPTGTTTTSTTTTTINTAYRDAVDITFPADPRVTYSRDYDAPRSGGRVHKATDLMGQKHWKLYAAVAGTVCFLTGIDSPMPSYGYMLTICGTDGRSYSYIHINNDDPGTDDGLGGPEFAYAPTIRRGLQVVRGQWIAQLGDSGNAEGTSAHLHFEIEDPRITDPYGTHQIDPYASLQAAKQRRDLPVEPGTPVLDTVERVAGADRVATAIAMSQSAFERAAHVVVASSSSVADSIAAGPLAAGLDGPVLISGATHVDARVVQEIRRLGATAVTLVGGMTALAASFESDIAAQAGLPPTAVSRVAGQDRYDTAGAVADLVWRDTPSGQRRVIVALGNHPDPARAWPDALTAGWLGAVTGGPVVLVGLDGVPDPTIRAMSGVRDLIVVGGTNAVTDAVAAYLQELVPNPLRRLSGADRYATSAAVAEYAVARGASLTRVWAMTGRSPADALAAGAAVARHGEVLVLIDGLEQRSDGHMGRWLRGRVHQIATARVIGGTTVMNDAARTRLARRIT